MFWVFKKLCTFSKVVVSLLVNLLKKLKNPSEVVSKLLLQICRNFLSASKLRFAGGVSSL